MDASVAHLKPSLQPAISRRFSPELTALVFGHLRGDICTLQACSLVCTSWTALAHPFLLHKIIVYYPPVETRTWCDFAQLLTMSPIIGKYVRCLTFCGRKQPGELIRVREVVIDDIREALERLPLLTELRIQKGEFRLSRALPILVTEPPTRPPSRTHHLQLLLLEETRFITADPFYELFTHLDRVDTLVIKNISCVIHEPLPRILGQLHVSFGTIQVDCIWPVPQHFWDILHQCLVPRAICTETGLSISTSLEGPFSSLTLKALLVTFSDRNVRSFAINVLWSTCRPKHLVDGTVDSNTIRNFFPQLPLTLLSSIRDVVLYFTTTSMTTGRRATCLYSRLLENNWKVLMNSPTQLTHIELRFQRFGLHMQSVLDDLRAMHDPIPSHGTEVGWKTVDEGTIARFPNLETFTCVLCDGGFVDQHGPFDDAEVDTAPDHGNSSMRRQREFDDYVDLLTGFLPQLYENGLLRFRMSEVY